MKNPWTKPEAGGWMVKLRAAREACQWIGGEFFSRKPLLSPSNMRRNVGVSYILLPWKQSYWDNWDVVRACWLQTTTIIITGNRFFTTFSWGLHVGFDNYPWFHDQHPIVQNVWTCQKKSKPYLPYLSCCHVREWMQLESASMPNICKT